MGSFEVLRDGVNCNRNTIAKRSASMYAVKYLACTKFFGTFGTPFLRFLVHLVHVFSVYLIKLLVCVMLLLHLVQDFMVT